MSTAVATTDPYNGPPTKPATSQRLLVHDDGPTAYLFDSARFEQMYRIAKAMASASLLPDHLAKDPKTKEWLPDERVVGNCLLVVNQSIRWGFDPFAVMPETYVVGNKLGFQGKLVAAVVNYRAPLLQRLRYEFSGSGDDRTVTVIGWFKGEDSPRTVDCRLKDVRTDNKMWRADPDQKLCYTGVTKWARRHCPEIMLGVLTDDDLERMQESTFDGQTAARMEAILGGTRATATPQAAAQPEPEPAPALPPVDPLAELSELLASATTIRECATLCAAWAGPESTLPSAELLAEAERRCLAREAEIRAGRGERANQRELLDKGSPTHE
jgi:hypothetical protein